MSLLQTYVYISIKKYPNNSSLDIKLMLIKRHLLLICYYLVRIFIYFPIK